MGITHLVYSLSLLYLEARTNKFYTNQEEEEGKNEHI